MVVGEDKLETSHDQFLFFLEHFYPRVAKQLEKCPDFYKNLLFRYIFYIVQTQSLPMTTMSLMFEKMPKDVQSKICERIVYPQPQELLDELSNVLVERELMRVFHNGECRKLKPTRDEILAEMLKIPGFMEKFMDKNEKNKERDARTIVAQQEHKRHLREKFV